MRLPVHLAVLTLLSACALPARPEQEVGARIRLGEPLLRHAAGVGAMAYSPDGKVLASVGEDRALRVWDAASGRELFSSDIGRTPKALAFSSDGRTLAVGGASPDIRLFNLPSGHLARTIRTPQSQIQALAFSPRGPALAAAGDSNILLWESSDAVEPRTLAGHANWVAALAFSPDGRVLASCGDGDAVLLWDLAGRDKPARLEGPRFVLASTLAFAPTGSSLAAGSADGRVRLWNMAERKVSVTLDAGRPVIGAAWSPDGTQVAATSGHRDCVVWDAAVGRVVRRIDTRSRDTRRVVFSPDGKHIATAGAQGQIRLWSAADGAEIVPLGDGHRGRIHALTTLSDGIVSGGEDGTILVWAVPPAKPPRKLEGHDAEVLALACAPDGSLLASGGVDHGLRFWNPGTGTSRRSDAGGIVVALSFSPDGKRLAVATSGGAIRWWDPATGTATAPAVDNAGPVTSMSTSRSGALAWGEAGGSARILSGTDVVRLDGHVGAVTGVDFSPSGSVLATCGEDGSVRFWDPRGQSPSFRLASLQRPARAVAFSPDGRWLLGAGDGDRVKLWETATGDEIFSLECEDGPVERVAFARRGQALVAATARGTILVWSVERSLPRHEGAIRIEDLSSTSALRATAAVFHLSSQGDDVLPALRERLSAEAPNVQRLIARLDDPDPDEREKASIELEWAASERDLREALDGGTAERRARLDAVRAARTLPRVRWARGLLHLRAINVLERVGTPAAKELLRSISSDPAPRAAREAIQALERLQ